MLRYLSMNGSGQEIVKLFFRKPLVGITEQVAAYGDKNPGPGGRFTHSDKAIESAADMAKHNPCVLHLLHVVAVSKIPKAWKSTFNQKV